MFLHPKSWVVGALMSVGLAATAALDAHATEYKVDPNHTYPSFAADHMGLDQWRGKFDSSSGTIMLDKQKGEGSVDIEIDPASIDYGLSKLNDWAKSDKFLDVAKYPHASYKGKLVDFHEGAPTRVDGELTLHGVTKPVSLKIETFKCMPHPMLKRELCGVEASATIQRDQFGLEAGKDYGFKMDVALQIQVEAIAVE
jgi:polyisoprenoid-binding protein YceI